MEPVETVKQAYQQIVERLTTRFIAGGYQIVHQQSDDMVFGSCYTIWSNNQDALRLTWDGKESWFILEEGPLPISAVGAWAEIIVAPFGTEDFDAVNVNIIIQDILDSLD